MDQVYGRGACENTEYAFYDAVFRVKLFMRLCALKEITFSFLFL